MQNVEAWRPTKFVVKHGQLTATNVTSDVRASSWLMADIIAAFYQEQLPKYAHGSLIDLGCGKVPLYATYKNLVKKIVCVDWQHSVHGLSFLDFECDLNKALPFNDGEFDTVILSDVLEHVADPIQLWSEISRILNANGKFLMNAPFFYPIHERPYDYYRYTEFSLKRFAELSHLNIILLKPMGGSLEVLTDFLAKHLEAIPLLGAACAKLLCWATRSFQKTGWGESLSTKTGHWFPFGYFLIAEKGKTSA